MEQVLALRYYTIFPQYPLFQEESKGPILTSYFPNMVNFRPQYLLLFKSYLQAIKGTECTLVILCVVVASMVNRGGLIGGKVSGSGKSWRCFHADGLNQTQPQRNLTFLI